MDLIFPLLILFMIGLVFMSSRQRKKQENQQKSLQNSLHVGDVVVMTSGVSGTVVDTDDERTIDLEIAPDVVTTWLRAAVREKLVAPEDTDGAEELDDIDGAERLDAAHSADGVVPPSQPAEATTVAETTEVSRDTVTSGTTTSGAATSDSTDTTADSARNVSSPRSS